MRRTSAPTLALVCLVAAAGCSVKPRVHLGDTDAPAALGASLSDYEGSWEGYAEAFEWADGTDVVRLRITGTGDGALQVGSADAPPLSFDHPVPVGLAFKPLFAGLQPGYDYSIQGATVTARRIQLGTSTARVYEDWCPTFMPIADLINVGSFDCLPNLGFTLKETGCFVGSDADGSLTPIPCGHLACSQTCLCDADSCTARDRANDVRIDAALALEGEELAGTLLVGHVRINIRMMRVGEM